MRLVSLANEPDEISRVLAKVGLGPRPPIVLDVAPGCRARLLDEGPARAPHRGGTQPGIEATLALSMVGVSLVHHRSRAARSADCYDAGVRISQCAGP